jgi:hypothetical protein
MRILYLEPGQDFAGIMQHLLDRWTADLALPPLDLAESHPQKSERSQIIITNALHFGAFDKSDEAMLNDYEELMGLLRTGEPVALDFSDIVLSFLSKDPASLEKPVEQEWSDTAVDGRLVFASPVPLNEEQRDPGGSAPGELSFSRNRRAARVREEPYNRRHRVRSDPHRPECARAVR